MSEVSDTKVPPMMAAIKSGDHRGDSFPASRRAILPMSHECYQVMIGDWPRDDEAFPLELAVLENRMDMVQLLIECGADLTHNPEELLWWFPAQSRPNPVFLFGRCGSQNPRNAKGYMQAVSPLGGSG